MHEGIVGIITGIMTTAILYTVKVLWTSKVTPYLTKTRYQGVEVDGQWGGFVEVTEKDVENGIVGPPFKSEHSLFLEQNAHSLSGSLLFKFKNPEKEFTLDFKVTGYMWEGYLTLNFVPKDKRITSYATALLKLHDGGKTLVGMWLFRDVNQETVNHTTIYLTRMQS